VRVDIVAAQHAEPFGLQYAVFMPDLRAGHFEGDARRWIFDELGGVGA